MRLTRRGKVVFGSMLALTFLFNPLTQTQATAPKPVQKQIAAVWTAETSMAHAKSRLVDYGWAAREWKCLKTLWTKESNWRHAARNKQPVTQIRNGKRVHLHAGGIPQILGLNPKLPAPVQIRKGMDYIDSRYGTPCNAWSHWVKKAGHDLHGGWY